MLPPGSRPSNCSTPPTFEKLQRLEELPPMQVPVRKLCFVGLPRFLLLWPNPPSMKVEYHHISWHVIDIEKYTIHRFQMSVFSFWRMTEAFAAMGSSDCQLHWISMNIAYIGISLHIGMSLLSWWLPWIWICRANLDAAKTWNGLHALCLKDEHRVRARPQMWPKWDCFSHDLQLHWGCREPQRTVAKICTNLNRMNLEKQNTTLLTCWQVFWRLLAIAHGSWCQAACALVRCKRRARVCTTRRIDSWWLSGLGWWYEIVRIHKMTQARLTNWWLRWCMWKSMPAWRCNMALSALERSQIPIPGRERQRADSWFWHRSACQRFQPQTRQPKTLQTPETKFQPLFHITTSPALPSKSDELPLLYPLSVHTGAWPEIWLLATTKRNTAHRHEPCMTCLTQVPTLHRYAYPESKRAQIRQGKSRVLQAQDGQHPLRSEWVQMDAGGCGLTHCHCVSRDHTCFWIKQWSWI